MRTGELISVREYLSTDYEPDCDYVDGFLLERNVGEKDHGKAQKAIILVFEAHREEWGVEVFQEQRVQVSPTRFRVPDICVVTAPEPDEQIFTRPPLICIEVLSPEDRLAAMQQKVQDYIAMGVPYVWIVDPFNFKAYRCTSAGLYEVAELRVENSPIVVPLSVIFARIAPR